MNCEKMFTTHYFFACKKYNPTKTFTCTKLPKPGHVALTVKKLEDLRKSPASNSTHPDFTSSDFIKSCILIKIFNCTAVIIETNEK